MTITKSLTAVFVGVGLTASGLLLGQTLADSGSSSTPAPAAVTTKAVQTAFDASVAPQAAERAGLLQQCIAGQQSAEAAAHYRATAAAHPEHAAHISPDCTIQVPQVGQP
jgi:hypothetical protein